MVDGFNNPQDRRPLSAKQDAVLRALVKFISAFHRQPSYRELGELMSVSNVQRYLAEIEAAGWIRRRRSDDGHAVARSIEIPDDVYEDITGAMDAPETGTARGPMNRTPGDGLK